MCNDNFPTSKEVTSLLFDDSFLRAIRSWEKIFVEEEYSLHYRETAGMLLKILSRFEFNPARGVHVAGRTHGRASLRLQFELSKPDGAVSVTRFSNSGASRVACIRSFVKVRTDDRCLNSRLARDAFGRSLRSFVRSTLTSKGVAFECLVHKSMSVVRSLARYSGSEPVRLSRKADAIANPWNANSRA